MSENYYIAIVGGSEEVGLYRRLLKEVLPTEFQIFETGAQFESYLGEHSNCGLALVTSAMPPVSGLEMVRNVRRSNSQVPLIVTSGGSFEESAMQAGADVYIEKPGGLDELQQTVQRLYTEYTTSD